MYAAETHFKCDLYMPIYILLRLNLGIAFIVARGCSSAVERSLCM